ncbi:MAG: hypothetical protein M1838_001964, partial [Thelocarpon superellum]
LKLETLEQLAAGPRGGTRDAAIGIICERAATGQVYFAICAQAESPHVETRTRALVALRYLAHSTAVRKINSFPTYHALTTALIYTLKDTRRATRPLGRPANERIAMEILAYLLPYKVPIAVRAGIVRHWLACYPFGVGAATRLATINQLRLWKANDDLMSQIICLIETHPDGREEMRMMGLLSPKPECNGSARGDGEAGEAGDSNPTVNGDRLRPGGWDMRATDGEGIGSPQRTRRVREESVEEQMIRRRRREAMVLSDGILPLGSQNIIQSGEGSGGRGMGTGTGTGTSPWDEEAEDEVEEIMGLLQDDLVRDDRALERALRRR